MSAGIDSVLQAAVDGGVVPQVVAMAADADGPIYEGAAGPRAVGESDPVAPDTHFRIASMTKMVATTAALQQVERGNLDLDAPVEQYVPEFAEPAGARGLRRRYAAPAPARDQGDGAPARHPHQRALVLVLEHGHRALRGDHRDAATCSPARGRSSRRRSSADPGAQLEYGINTDWLGLVVEAASGQSLDAYLAEHILGPLGMELDHVHDDPGAARQLGAGAPARRGAARGPRPTSTGPRSRSGGPAATGSTRPRATTSIPAHAARRGRARRRPHPRGGDRRRRRSRTRSASSSSRPRSRPRTRAPRPTSTPGRATSSASGCSSTSRTSRARGRRAAAPGRASSTPTSGSTAPPA